MSNQVTNYLQNSSFPNKYTVDAYSFSNWFNTSNNTDLAPAGGSQHGTPTGLVTFGYSAPTMTLTFNAVGMYKLSFIFGNSSSGAYTYKTTRMVAIGGSVTVYSNVPSTNGYQVWGDPTSSADSATAVSVIVNSSIAGQTYTFQPSFNIGGASISSHQSWFSIIVEYLG